MKAFASAGSSPSVIGQKRFHFPQSFLDSLLETVPALSAEEQRRFLLDQLEVYINWITGQMVDDFLRAEASGADFIIWALDLPSDMHTATYLGPQGAQLVLVNVQSYEAETLLANRQAIAAISLKPESDIWSLPDPRRDQVNRAFERRFNLLEEP